MVILSIRTQHLLPSLCSATGVSHCYSPDFYYCVYTNLIESFLQRFVTILLSPLFNSENYEITRLLSSFFAIVSAIMLLGICTQYNTT